MRVASCRVAAAAAVLLERQTRPTMPSISAAVAAAAAAAEVVRAQTSHLTNCRRLHSSVSAMPRVVSDQLHKFLNDELFRKLSRESEIRYTGYRDRPIEERRIHLQTQCTQGHIDIAFVGCGINLSLAFPTASQNWNNTDQRSDRTAATTMTSVALKEFVDFDLEQDKVHLKSEFIMNGVCVVWRGWLDLRRLDGTARLEFDEQRALMEDSLRHGIKREKVRHPTTTA